VEDSENIDVAIRLDEVSYTKVTVEKNADEAGRL
jgi:hypothetical protein